MTTTTTTDVPLRVWLYRGWCWVCNRCNPTPGTAAFLRRPQPEGDRPSAGYGYPDQAAALAAALLHCGER